MRPPPSGAEDDFRVADNSLSPLLQVSFPMLCKALRYRPHASLTATFLAGVAEDRHFRLGTDHRHRHLVPSPGIVILSYTGLGDCWSSRSRLALCRERNSIVCLFCVS